MKRLVTLLISCLLIGCGPQTEELVVPETNSIVYEIYVGAFNDSDGDGMGDLKGVTQKLDYIRSLGATSIWLMPIHQSNTYHKYDVNDYQSIDSQYGTLEDFDELITEMKKRDMELILDLVLNHSSASHPWFLEAKEAQINGTCDASDKCDYYHFSNTPQAGFTRLADEVYYESVFWDQMPDLNLKNPSVRKEFEGIIKFWLDKGVGGFRLDATTHFERENVESNVEVLSWLNSTVKKIKPDAYIVGEAWTSNSIVQKMYESNVDSFFNFGLSQNDGSIVKSINNSWGHDLALIKANHDETIQTYNPNAIDAIFLSNHDNNRSAGYLSVSEEKQKLATAVYMLMPGNVYIYYGEEVGMLGSGKDENKRLAMPWFDDSSKNANNPSGSDYKQDQPLSVEKALEDKDSLLYYYRNLGALRNKYPSISRSGIKAIETGNRNVYLMEHDDLYVIHNFSNNSQTVTFSSKISDIVTVNGTVKHDGGSLILEPYASAILLK